MNRIENIVMDDRSRRSPIRAGTANTDTHDESSLSNILSTYRVVPVRARSKSTGTQAVPNEESHYEKGDTDTETGTSGVNDTNINVDSENVDMMNAPSFHTGCRGMFELVGDSKGVKWSQVSQYTHAANATSSSAVSLLEEILGQSPSTGLNMCSIASNGDMLRETFEQGGNNKLLIVSNDNNDEYDANSDLYGTRQQPDLDESINQNRNICNDNFTFSPRHTAYYSRTTGPGPSDTAPHSLEPVDESNITSTPMTPNMSQLIDRNRFNLTNRTANTLGGTGTYNVQSSSSSSLLQEILLKQQESIQSNNEIMKLLVDHTLVHQVEVDANRKLENERNTKAVQALNMTK